MSLANDIKKPPRRKRPRKDLPIGRMSEVSATGFKYVLYGIGPINPLTVEAAFAPDPRGTAIAVSTYVTQRTRWSSLLSDASWPFIFFTVRFGLIQPDDPILDIAVWVLIELLILAACIACSVGVHYLLRNWNLRKDRPGVFVSTLFDAAPATGTDAPAFLDTIRPAPPTVPAFSPGRISAGLSARLPRWMRSLLVLE